jgi:DNA-binding GntR family transcriptional regulator
MGSDKRSVLSVSIAMQLEEAIIAGEIEAGTHLDEASIAEKFEVSRTPVREALHLLAARCLAVRMPYRGTIVSEISPEKISELFEAMGEIEATCGRFAAERMRIEERAELVRLHEEMGELAVTDDLLGYEAANTRFHQLIYNGAHNAEFRAIADAMRLKLAPFRSRQLIDHERARRSHQEHTQIVDAILNRDGGAATKALRRHLVSAAKAMLQQWQRAPGMSSQGREHLMKRSGKPHEATNQSAGQPLAQERVGQRMRHNLDS